MKQKRNSLKLSFTYIVCFGSYEGTLSVVWGRPFKEVLNEMIVFYFIQIKKILWQNIFFVVLSKQGFILFILDIPVVVSRLAVIVKKQQCLHVIV